MSADDAKQLTKAERIANLNEIDRDVVELLSLVSKAVGMLSKDNYETANPQLDDAKKEFSSISADYAAKLSAIEVKSRREVYALEEAELIATGTKRDGDRAAQMNEDQISRRSGGGPLDSSYLNARAKDAIGRGLEREVLDDAKAFLKKNNIVSTIEVDVKDEMQIDSDHESL